jgi:hypothetical protein
MGDLRKFQSGMDGQLPHPSSVVYICAPYGDPDPEVVHMNIEDAEAMARFAAHMGYSPVVVHSYIAPVFGDDSDAEQRREGLNRVLSVAWAVANAGGQLWVVSKEDKRLTAGCAEEVAIFQRAQHKEVEIHTFALSEWISKFAEFGFVDSWGVYPNA